MPDANQLAAILLQKNILNQKQMADFQEYSKKTGKTLEEVLMEGKNLTNEQLEEVVTAIHEWQFINLHKESTNGSTNGNGAGIQTNGNGNSNGKNKEIWGRFRNLIELHAQEASFGQTKDSSVVKIVDLLLEQGCQRKASDIHIEPERNYTAVRFRVDGVMYDVVTLPKNMYEKILTRVKILARLRTDEHQVPQDGKLQFEYENQLVDIRVSVVPTIKGENIVMRLLSETVRQYTLEALGLNEKDYKKAMKYVQKPWGMILVTGPTGSGKTTTLYAILQILNRRDLNIITIEDPVEYYIEGITQIQVNTKADLTFANGLRAIVRQDPNIIMVGEIRDEETADIAINSGMTGHLVLSTMHTNDAVTALPRFLEMGVKPFLVASTVNVVIAQRLVRQICRECVVECDEAIADITLKMPEIALSKLVAGKEKIRIYKGKGCEKCKNTGYHGRIGIFEILEMTEEIQSLIMHRADANSIRQKAIEQGMTTMFDDAVSKALAGKITIDEIIRVIKQ